MVLLIHMRDYLLKTECCKFFFCVCVGCTQKLHRTLLPCAPVKFPWRRIYFWDHRFACVLSMNSFERRRVQYFPVFLNFLFICLGFVVVGLFFFGVVCLLSLTELWFGWLIARVELFWHKCILLPQDFQVLLNTVVFMWDSRNVFFFSFKISLIKYKISY